MTVLEAIEKRYSCRAYQDRQIEREKLLQVLEAARLAPTAKNLQDAVFVVVTDKEMKRKVAHASNEQMFIEKAGAIIVACSENEQVMRCGQQVGPIDAAIALDHISLRAIELGLGTCWIGSFFPDKIRPLLGIPEKTAIIELMAVGYPADERKERKREGLEKRVCFERWQF